ncbi:MAG: rhodanese-like domain-containing protein [Acidimicrobiia bacterium]
MFRPPPPDVPAVTAEEAAAMVDDGALLIDIRELKEWKMLRIPGADFKPMSEIQDWYEDLPRDVDIILQCRSGQRSGQATQALINQAGFDRVFNLTGGIIAWHSANLPVDRGPVPD